MALSNPVWHSTLSNPRAIALVMVECQKCCTERYFSSRAEAECQDSCIERHFSSNAGTKLQGSYTTFNELSYFDFFLLFLWMRGMYCNVCLVINIACYDGLYMRLCMDFSMCYMYNDIQMKWKVWIEYDVKEDSMGKSLWLLCCVMYCNKSFGIGGWFWHSQ